MDWLLPETDGFAIGLRLFIDFLGVMAALATGRSFASSWRNCPSTVRWPFMTLST